MAENYNRNLFGRLTQLFRSGPIIRRKVKGMTQKAGNTSSALEVFRSAHSDVYNSTLSAYGAFDRMSRYSDFSEMESTPEIASALDIYAEETVSSGEDGRILHIYSDNRKVQEILESLFYDTLNVEFNLVMWVRNLCKYGDFFLFNDISPEYGVINCVPISISEIEREEGFDPKDPMAVRYRWITQGNQILENWQVTHFRLLGNDAFLPYGSSVLEAARRIWRQLILIEDAMLVYRVIRAPERRVFYIDVGNVPPEEVANYLEQAQTSLKRNQIVDKTTGKVDLRYNPLSVDQDYFLPVRGGESGTKIDTLAGGQNTAAIEDVQYIQKKLFAALKIPRAYLGYDEDVGAKATLAQEDIRFSRSIHRIQKTILSELNKLAMIHLYSHGYEGEDLLDFTLKLSNPSSIAQLQKLELIKSKFEIAGQAPEGMVSRKWIRKNILNLTDQEIENIKDERSEDKLEDTAVEAAGQPGPSGGGEAASAPAGEEEAPAGGEEGGGLFSGDEPKGTLLTARPGTGRSEKDLTGDEEDKEDDVGPQFKLSIDDPDAPLKALNRIEKSTKPLNMFGEPIEASRRVTDGPASTHMPNFAKMTGTGTTQGTLRNPYDKNWIKNSFESAEPKGDFMSNFLDKKMSQQKRMTDDMKNTLDKFAATVRINSPAILKEADSNRDNEPVDIDLESLGSKLTDE
jgi:hypothetical protein